MPAHDLKNARMARLQNAMDRADIDTVAIVPGANFYYLTGINLHLMERPTVLFVRRDGSSYGVIPFLEKSRWAASMPEVETVYWHDSDGYDGAFSSLSRSLTPGRIGVEGQRMRYFETEAIRRAWPGSSISDGQDVISHMRLHKDASEIAVIRRAIEISEIALRRTLDAAVPGMSEVEFRQRLVSEMLTAGGDGPAFDTTVLSGGAAADPHGTPSHERKLERGKCLLIDYGASWGGYAADITRTFFVGEAGSRERDIYAAVLAANEMGRSLARPGRTFDDLDRQVTGSLRDAGYGDLIVHKTGHGLGLDIHEAPQVMIGNMGEMEPGMVMTIEPGLYVPGDIGIRIEDNIVITEDGCETLTSFDRSLTLI